MRVVGMIIGGFRGYSGTGRRRKAMRAQGGIHHFLRRLRLAAAPFRVGLLENRRLRLRLLWLLVFAI